MLHAACCLTACCMTACCLAACSPPGYSMQVPPALVERAATRPLAHLAPHATPAAGLRPRARGGRRAWRACPRAAALCRAAGCCPEWRRRPATRRRGRWHQRPRGQRRTGGAATRSRLCCDVSELPGFKRGHDGSGAARALAPFSTQCAAALVPAASSHDRHTFPTRNILQAAVCCRVVPQHARSRLPPQRRRRRDRA